jgi:hypothetical protein
MKARELNIDTAKRRDGETAKWERDSQCTQRVVGFRAHTAFAQYCAKRLRVVFDRHLAVSPSRRINAHPSRRIESQG